MFEIVMFKMKQTIRKIEQLEEEVKNYHNQTKTKPISIMNEELSKLKIMLYTYNDLLLEEEELKEEVEVQ